MSITVKFSAPRGTRTLTAIVENTLAAIELCKELSADWRCSVEYETVEDGEEPDALDPKVFGGGAQFASTLSSLDRDLFESADMHVEFARGSDGTMKVSKIVRKRDPEYVGGSEVDHDADAYKADPVSYAWFCDHQDLLNDEPSEEDALAHVAESFTENGVHHDEDEDNESVACPSDKWDVIFWIEADEFGRKFEMDPGCTKKALPVMLAKAYHKPLKGEAVGILAAIQKGNITRGRQLWLACQRVERNEASKLWDAFKVAQYLRNKK